MATVAASVATYSTAAPYSTATRTSDMTLMQRIARKMWAPWVIMGLMIVVITFIIALFVQSAEADFFSNPKAVRDAAVAGGVNDDIVKDKQFIEATKAWLPTFKFLGLGMMLGGITFLLATILGNLRAGGAAVQRSLGAEVKFFKPWIANVFPMFMMMGMMVIMAALGIGIWLGAEASNLYGHSIAQIDGAPTGSKLLRDLGTIAAVQAWLTPFKFLGMALLFSGIALALLTIVRVLRWQTGRLVEIVEKT